VAVVGVALAAAGHGLGGAPVAVTPLLVLVGLLLAAACVLVSRTRWTPSRLLGVLLGIQAVVHATLWFESGSHPVDDRLAGLAAPAHAHDHVAAGGASPALMLAAHLAAAVVAAALLASLEGALWLLVALARRILRAVPRVPIPVLPRTSTPAARTSAIPALVLGAVGRRGPPGVLAPA
jgi:hypothetical protein